MRREKERKKATNNNCFSYSQLCAVHHRRYQVDFSIYVPEEQPMSRLLFMGNVIPSAIQAQVEVSNRVLENFRVKVFRRPRRLCQMLD